MKRKSNNFSKVAVAHSKTKYGTSGESNLLASAERTFDANNRNFPSIHGTQLKNRTMDMHKEEVSKQGFPSEADISAKTKEIKRSTENSQAGRHGGGLSLESTLKIDNNYGVQVHVAEISMNNSQSKATLKDNDSERLFPLHSKNQLSAKNQVMSQGSFAKGQTSSGRTNSDKLKIEDSGPKLVPIMHMQDTPQIGRLSQTQIGQQPRMTHASRTSQKRWQMNVVDKFAFGKCGPVTTEIIQNAYAGTSGIEPSPTATELNHTNGGQTNTVSEQAYDQDEPGQLPEYTMSPVKMANHLMETAQSTMKMSKDSIVTDNQLIVEHNYMQGQGDEPTEIVPIPLTSQSQIGNVTVETKNNGKTSRRSLLLHSSIYSKEGNETAKELASGPSLRDESEVRMSIEAKISAKVLASYQRKKKKHLKTTRVFSDEMIAQLDKATERRTDMVASLLGNSREARDIQKQFRKMVEVPQEDFDINNYKLLATELRKMQKPDQMYEQQLKINPRLAKKTITIEDFVQILPTSAESHTRMSEQPTNYHQRRDSLYQSSLASQPDEVPLAIMDDPAKTLAIQYLSKKQSAPNIQTLQSNLNSSIQVDDQFGDDENTFITNLVESSYVTQPKPGTLPNIKMKNQDLLVNNNKIPNQGGLKVSRYEQSQSKRDQVHYTNEYQLIPVQPEENSLTSIHDYKSASMLARESQMTLASSSIVANRKTKMGTMKSSLSTMPYSRETMLREKSELSFTAGHRRAMKSSSNKRILGEKNGYIHSSMSSALGRESRVLKRIYERVENIKKVELASGGSRLGTLQGYTESKRMSGSRTAGFRKNSVAQIPRPINTLSSERPTSIEQVNMTAQFENESFVGHENSSATLIDPNLQSSPDTKIPPSPHHVIVNTSVVLVKIQSDPLNTGENGRLITTMHGERDDSSNMVTHDFSNQQLQVLEKGKKTPNGSRRQNQSSKYLLPRQTPSENTRLDSQKVLNQYKQRRMLVGNMQLTKLIRKDMNMFANDGPKKREKRKGSTTIQTKATLETIPTKSLERSTLIDDASSAEENMKSVQDLMSKPLLEELRVGLQEGSMSVGTLTSEGRIDSNFKVAPQVESNPSQDALVTEPSNTVLTEPRMLQFEPHSFRQVSNDSIIIEVTNASKADRDSRKVSTKNQANSKLHQKRQSVDSSEHLIKSIHQSAALSKVDSRWERSDRIQQEVKQYYRNINNNMRNSNKKLSKVLIKGKNIFDSNTMMASQNSSLKSQPGTVKMGNQEAVKSQLKDDMVMTQYEQSEAQGREPDQPLSLQVSGKFNKPSQNRQTEDYTDGQGATGRLESGAVTSLGQLQQKVIKDHMAQILRGSQDVHLKGQSLMQQHLQKAANATHHNRIPVQREQQLIWNTVYEASSTPQVQVPSPNRIDSLVTTHYNDPYGTHNAAQFNSIYEEQKSKLVEPEVAGASQKGGRKRDPQHARASQDAKKLAQFAHNVQINSPFQYRTTQQQRTPSMRTDQQLAAEGLLHNNPAMHLSTLHRGGHSESNSRGTLEKNNSQAVSSQTITPSQSQIVSHINLNANFDLKAMQNFSQAKMMRGNAHNRSTSQENLQKKKEASQTRSDAVLMEAVGQNTQLRRLGETTFVDRAAGDSSTSYLGQTDGGTHQNKSSFQKKSNQSVQQSYEGLEQTSLPTIKIKMVLTSDQNQRTTTTKQQSQGQILLSTQKKLEEELQSNRDSSQIVITETNHETTFNVMAKRSQNHREPLHHPKSSTYRHHSLKTNESAENIDLLPVIQDNGGDQSEKKQARKDSKHTSN